MNTININGVLYEVYYSDTHIYEMSDMTDDTHTKNRYSVSNEYVAGTRVNPMPDTDRKYIDSISHPTVIHIDTDGIVASSKDAVVCPEIDLQKILDRIDFSHVDAKKISDINIVLNAYNGNTNMYSENVAVVYCGENYLTDTNNAVICHMN